MQSTLRPIFQTLSPCTISYKVHKISQLLTVNNNKDVINITDLRLDIIFTNVLESLCLFPGHFSFILRFFLDTISSSFLICKEKSDIIQVEGESVH